MGKRVGDSTVVGGLDVGSNVAGASVGLRVGSGVIASVGFRVGSGMMASVGFMPEPLVVVHYSW